MLLGSGCEGCVENFEPVGGQCWLGDAHVYEPSKARRSLENSKYRNNIMINKLVNNTKATLILDYGYYIPLLISSDISLLFVSPSKKSKRAGKETSSQYYVHVTKQSRRLSRISHHRMKVSEFVQKK